MIIEFQIFVLSRKKQIFLEKRNEAVALRGALGGALWESLRVTIFRHDLLKPLYLWRTIGASMSGSQNDLLSRHEASDELG